MRKEESFDKLKKGNELLEITKKIMYQSLNHIDATTKTRQIVNRLLKTLETELLSLLDRLEYEKEVFAEDYPDEVFLMKNDKVVLHYVKDNESMCFRMKDKRDEKESKYESTFAEIVKTAIKNDMCYIEFEHYKNEYGKVILEIKKFFDK